MLSFIYIFLGLSIIVLFFLNDAKYLRFYSLLFSSISFIYSVKLVLLFDCSNYYFQNIIRYSLNFELMNLQLSFGLDGISLFYFILSSFLIFLCVLFVFDEKHLKYYLLNLFIIELLLLLVFSVLDILLFYIFFEAILIPMYLVIGIWGSRERKNWEAYMLFFYTLCGSLLLLFGILYIYTITGTFNIEFLLRYNFSDTEQFFLWLIFFLSCASKILIFPVYIRISESGVVEAPTVGSVLAAMWVTKLKGYGFKETTLYDIYWIFITYFQYCSFFTTYFLFFSNFIIFFKR
jgi:NADH:ubiquinone oxidoreductase subunit 4 (subunit M)